MRVMTRLAGAAALLAIASFAQAQMESGFSLGVEGAYEDYGDDVDEVTYGIFAGYDHVFMDQWLVGAGVRGTIEGLDRSEEVVSPALTVRTRVEHDDQWGFSARVGRIFASRWLAFAQVEFDRFDLRTTRTERAQACAPPDGCVMTTRTTDEDHLWGGGAGLEFAATPNLRLRAMYSYGEKGSRERDRAALTVAWKF